VLPYSRNRANIFKWILKSQPWVGEGGTGNVSQRLPWGCIQQNICTNGKVKAAKRVSRYIYVYIIILSACATGKSLKDGF